MSYFAPTFEDQLRKNIKDNFWHTCAVRHHSCDPEPSESEMESKIDFAMELLAEHLADKLKLNRDNTVLIEQ